MTRTALAFIAVLPAIVAPATAQQTADAISATDFVNAQITVIEGMTELLSIKGIEKSPQDVATGINQLASIVQQLAAVKPTASSADAALIETELADKARAAATKLQQVLETTAQRNFYNSQELADAIQNFAMSFQALK